MLHKVESQKRATVAPTRWQPLSQACRHSVLSGIPRIATAHEALRAAIANADRTKIQYLNRERHAPRSRSRTPRSDRPKSACVPQGRRSQSSCGIGYHRPREIVRNSLSLQCLKHMREARHSKQSCGSAETRRTRSFRAHLSTGRGPIAGHWQGLRSAELGL